MLNLVHSKRTVLGGGVALALACPLLLAAPTTANRPTATVAAVPVTITGANSTTFAFTPPKVTIKAGKRVTWSWSGDAPHNVVFAKGRGSATSATGTFSRRFKAPGKFAYTCTVHGFAGKVVVK